jgi:short chain dehydrogenase
VYLAYQIAGKGPVDLMWAVGLAGQHRGHWVIDSLRDRVCLATGATSGIGKATAHALAAMGASVVLVGHDPQRSLATVQEIRGGTHGSEGMTVSPPGERTHSAKLNGGYRSVIRM